MHAELEAHLLYLGAWPPCSTRVPFAPTCTPLDPLSPLGLPVIHVTQVGLD